MWLLVGYIASKKPALSATSFLGAAQMRLRSGTSDMP
jgi:hypothetical protein